MQTMEFLRGKYIAMEERNREKEYFILHFGIEEKEEKKTIDNAFIYHHTYSF